MKSFKLAFALTFVMGVLLFVAIRVGIREASVKVDTIWHEEQSWEDLGYSMDVDSGWVSDEVHFIAGPVDVNCSTGEVVIAEGAGISAASVKFWRSLEDAYPRLFEKKGENGE